MQSNTDISNNPNNQKTIFIVKGNDHKMLSERALKLAINEATEKQVVTLYSHEHIQETQEDLMEMLFKLEVSGTTVITGINPDQITQLVQSDKQTLQNQPSLYFANTVIIDYPNTVKPSLEKAMDLRTLADNLNANLIITHYEPEAPLETHLFQVG